MSREKTFFSAITWIMHRRLPCEHMSHLLPSNTPFQAGASARGKHWQVPCIVWPWLLFFVSFMKTMSCLCFVSRHLIGMGKWMRVVVTPVAKHMGCVNLKRHLWVNPNRSMWWGLFVCIWLLLLVQAKHEREWINDALRVIPSVSLGLYPNNVGKLVGGWVRPSPLRRW